MGDANKFPITRGSLEHIQDGQPAGIDIGCPEGTPLLAIVGGIIERAGELGQCGLSVDLGVWRGGTRYLFRYCHAQKLFVHAGQVVGEGKEIAWAGKTGLTYGPHLHLAVWASDARIFPEVIMYKGIIDWERVTEALNIVWGWSGVLDVLTASSAAEELRAAVMAIKDELGMD